MKPSCLGIRLVLCIALLPALLVGQGPKPDFVIDNFSVFSTLPGPDGQRRLAVSFRVRNAGTANAPATRTRVTLAGTPSEFSIPALAPQAAAYITRTLPTTASQVPIKVEADVFKTVTESNEQNNVVEYTANPAGDFGRWQSVGPSKITMNPVSVGRVTTIAVSPISPFVVYAGARGSGLWKMAGQNAPWFPITDSLPSVQIDAVAIDPKNAERVLIATPSGVFESRDGGSLWTQLTSQNLLGAGYDGGALLVAGTPNPPLYLSARNGLKVSTDGGHTWTTVMGSGSPVLSLQFGTTDPTHLFASTATPPMVFEAKDRGLTAASWHPLQGCPGGALPTIPASSNVWIAESQGTQWMSFRSGAADGKRFELWRSTNDTCTINGFTEHRWVKLGLDGDCNDFNNQWSYLFAHPQDPTLVFKAGTALCRSTSSGDDLGIVSGLHADNHAIAFAPSSPAVMFFGNDGGIYRSPDKGKTMNFLGEGMSNTEFLKIDVNGAGPRVIVGGTQDNGTSSWDGSISPVWTYIGGGDSALVAFDRKDMKGVFEIGQSMRQIALHGPNGGASGLGNNDLADCIAYSESGVVFESMESTGDNPTVVLTCHGIWTGPPWKQVKDPNPGEFVRFRIAPDNRDIGAAATTDGHVFWGAFKQPSLLFDVFTAPNGGVASAIAFADQFTFYVANNAGGHGSITRFKCFLGCTNESVWPGTPDGNVTAIGIDPLTPDTLLAAISGSGVFRGTRDGAGKWTWVSYNNGLPVGVNVTDLLPRSNGSIAAGTYGRGAFVLTSRSTAPPRLTAKGHVISFDAGRADPDRPPGFNNPIVISVELDSKPGFLFDASHTPAGSTSVLRGAFKNHRLVTIDYTFTGQNSGKVVSAKFSGP